MLDEINAAKRKEDEARAEQVYAKIDPKSYYEKYGRWPEETAKQRQERERKERLDELDAIAKAEAKRGTIPPKPLTEEERRERDLNDRLEEVREVDAIMASHHQVKPAPAPKFANPYDDEDVAHAMEAMVADRRMKDAPKKTILEQLKDHLPESSEDLKIALELLDYRLDFMKELVEHYGRAFAHKSDIYVQDFSPEASAEVNKALSDYLNIVATLANCNYNFGSTTDSYTSNKGYDPYKPEMYMTLASSVMFRRARNGCDINIPIPRNYGVGGPTADAVTVLHYLDEQLKHNEIIEFYWDKLTNEALENTAPSGPEY